MGDFLHYSSDRAGVTDLFTNATQLCPPDREDPRHWLGPIGHGPPDQLLTFLHEATHHWCFRSVVGQALLFLAARADMNAHALTALSDDSDRPGEAEAQPDELWDKFFRDLGPLLRALVGDPRRKLGPRLESVRHELGLAVHDDVIRIQVALTLLRPLAEGLACFAEFDAVSRLQSKAWSPLPLSLVLNFAGRERLSRGPHVEPLKTLLVAGELLSVARSSALALSRKAGVLGHPLTCGSGGYLLGYLTVKSLWRHLQRQDFRLTAETDLALMYMRSFFYDDLGLAAALLQPTIPNSVQSTQRIIDHLNHRFAAFADVREADVHAYEEDVLASDGQTEWSRRPGLLRSTADDERDFHQVKSAQEDIHNSRATEVFSFASNIAFDRFQRIQKRRTYLTACSVPVRVADIDEGVGGLDVLWQGQHVLSIPPEDLVEEKPGQERGAGAGGADPSPLRLDILLGTAMAGGDFLARGAVLSAGERVLACTVSGLPEHRARIRDDMVADFRARDSLLQEGDAMQRIAAKVVEADWGLRANRDLILGHLDSLVDRLYRPTALGFARDGTDLDALADRMEQRGLLGVLRSPQVLRNMTLLGLYAGLDAHESSVAQSLRTLGVTLEDTLREAARLWETEGFPPPVLRNDGPDRLVLPFF